MPFTFQRAKLSEIIIITPKIYADERGFFLESYKASEFAENIGVSFVQDNHSYSTKGVLRGLHYQLPPREQGKLVRCVYGEIYDVAVDIRRTSPTFGKWMGIALSADNCTMCYIPPGFAHGFYTKSEEAHVMYKMTEEYAPYYERGILWNDNSIGIQWPSDKVILSDKDQQNSLLNNAELFG